MGGESRGFQGERRENQSLQTDYKTKTIEHRLPINCQLTANAGEGHKNIIYY